VGNQKKSLFSRSWASGCYAVLCSFLKIGLPSHYRVFLAFRLPACSFEDAIPPVSSLLVCIPFDSSHWCRMRAILKETVISRAFTSLTHGVSILSPRHRRFEHNQSQSVLSALQRNLYTCTQVTFRPFCAFHHSRKVLVPRLQRLLHIWRA